MLKPMLNARGKLKLKVFMVADKLIVEKDGKRNTYTFNVQEDGLKVVRKEFRLELSQLLSVEHANEDAMEEEYLDTGEHLESGRPVVHTLNICSWNPDSFMRFKDNREIIKFRNLRWDMYFRNLGNDW